MLRTLISEAAPVDEQRWKAIEAIYIGALDAPDRDAFLDQACQDDAELRLEVERLLHDETSTIHLLGRAPSISAATLTAGSTFGEYEIVELLGSGGSSDVYRAFDRRLARDVALKVFTNAAFVDDFRSRFEREAKAAASLNHPNIATVYEVGQVDDYWFIAMEYIDGVTFREKLDDEACSLDERLRYLGHVAGALARAHSGGIVHCDLKPENVMVTGDGVVKILDFGLARLVRPQRADVAPAATDDTVHPAAERRRIEGTIGYMSPEQASGEELGARTDVFAFGCMLFEAIANRLPFWSPSLVRSLHNLTHEPAPRLEAYVRKVPRRLQRLVEDCLAKDPAARPESMEEVNRRLQEVIEPRSTWALRIAASLAALLAVGAPLGYWALRTQPSAGSVAVIPFSSGSSSGDNEMVAGEITEGLIQSLTQLPDLKVTARASSVRFAATGSDLRQIARTLGVRTLVTGTVTLADGDLRVAAELIDGENGSALWGAQFDRRAPDIGDLQLEIAAEVARRVRSGLTAADQRRLARTIHPNPDVYALLLRGRYQMSLYTPDSTQKAASYFEQALGIDPSYAMANAELASTYRRMAGYGILDPRQAMPMAERAAMRAIASDAELAEGHTALADIKRDQWQWAASMREYDRAIALSPSYIPAHEGMAIGLSVMGQGDAAVAELQRIRALDPVSVPGAVDATALFYNVRRFDRALDTVTEAMRRDSAAPALWTWTGIVLGGSRNFSGALSAFEKAIGLGDTTNATQCYYIHTLAQAGRREEARRRLDAVERSTSFVPPSSLAIAYAGLDEKDRAFDFLQRGFTARDPLLQYIVVEPFLDRISDDPRFGAIVAGMGLPPVKR